MSSIRHSSSFINVTNRNLKNQQLDAHKWLYTAGDLSNLHDGDGKFGLVAEMGGVQGLAGALRTDIHGGLFSDEVQGQNFSNREMVYGRNVYPKTPPRSFLSYCAEALEDKVLVMLVVAGIVSIGIGAVHGDYIEGIAILVAVVVVTLVGAGNNWHMERQFQKKDSSKEAEKCNVIRADNQIEILQDDLLVGDLVSLSAGNRIPADGILVSHTPVKCDEASVTGESDAIVKDYYRPFLIGGSELVEGECVMLTTAVGSNSFWGKLMKSLDSTPEETPLQIKLKKVADLISYIGFAIAFLLFIALIIRWGLKDEFTDKVTGLPTTERDYERILDFLIICFALIVAAVPEGLPLAVVVTLALSRRKMMADNNLVRVLSACETMGNATAICTDKTGTLTTNKMTVVKCFLGNVFYETIPKVEQLSDKLRQLLIQGVVVNSKTFVDQKDPKQADPNKPPESWKWREGNATEKALLSWMCRYGIDIKEQRTMNPATISYPFDSVKKRSSVILSNGTGFRRFYKGAAEAIVESCSTRVNEQDEVVPITEADREHILSTLTSMTGTGLRTIAFGYADYAELAKDADDQYVDPGGDVKLTFFGVVGIKDPPRPGAGESVAICQRAGVVVRMVTGDHLETAKFIAREVNILTSESEHIAMEGKDFRRLIQAGMEDQLKETIPKLRVLARSLPEDKRLLVKWLRDNGEVVGVTGDGTNDAPALKEADVGLAMFMAGTQVARNAAQINILDDNFTSIVKSVMWGRSVFDNIRKFVQFQLTVNVVALLLSLIGAISDSPSPLNAVQLLWVNMIMDTFAALALATEDPHVSILNRMPYSPDASLVSPIMWRNILTQSAFQLGLLCWIMYSPDLLFGETQQNQEKFGEPLFQSQEHTTLIFNTFVWLQIFNIHNARKCNGEWNIFENFFKNWVFLFIFVLCMVMQLVLLQYIPDFVSTVPLTVEQWGICIGLGACCIPWGFIMRAIICCDNSAGRVQIAENTFAGAKWKNEPFTGRFFEEEQEPLVTASV